MKRRTDIFTRLLWLLSLLMVACTGHDAIVDDLSQQDASVTVRMQVSDMKETASRAAEKDNITSIVALVFRNNQLQSVTEYSTANSALHPISPITGTITINKPENGDVIHFLANLPANYSNEKTYIQYLNEKLNQSQENVLCDLTSSDYSKLSYWGMATYNSNDAVMDVLLYRNKAMIEIKPDEGCTFQENELFIAGLDNPNNLGKLVPYNDGFNFNLDSNDYLTIPDNPNPLDKTDELTNYGAGYDNAYYVFEHENPKDANGLYVICKIGNDYYKVALQDDAGNHYSIIRNHKYTILVKDLDAGCDTYADALNADPVNLKVTVNQGEGTPLWNNVNGQLLQYDPYGFVTDKDIIRTLTAGQTIFIEMVCSHDTAGENKLAVLVNGNWDDLPSLDEIQNQYSTFSKETTSYSFVLSESDIASLNSSNNGIYLVGSNITITRIYVK